MVAIYLTPYKIALLVLVECFCFFQFASDVVQPILGFLVDCLCSDASAKEPTLSELCKQLTEAVGGNRSPEELLRDRLKHIQTPDDLYDLFEGLRWLLPMHEDPDKELGRDNLVLYKGSLFGVFVRRSRLALMRLAFEEVCHLKNATIKWIDGLSAEPDGEGIERIPQSVHDEERFLDLKVNQLLNHKEDMGFADLNGYLSKAQAEAPYLAKFHFVRALNATRVMDHENAVSQTRRFFDYSLIYRESSLYQYALLNLAMLETHFGQPQQAWATVEEAVHVARENGDFAGVSFAMSLASQLTKRGHDIARLDVNNILRTEQGVPETGEAIPFPYLTSLHHLQVAMHYLDQGVAPDATLRHMLSSSVINNTHSLKNMRDMTNLCIAHLWKHFGQPILSSLYTDLVLSRGPNVQDTSDLRLALEQRFGKRLSAHLCQASEPFTSRQAFPRRFSWSDLSEAEYDPAQTIFSLHADAANVKGTSQEEQLNIWLAMARLHIKYGSMTRAIPLLLQCISVSEQCRLRHINNVAIVSLCEQLLNLGLSIQACKTLEALIPQILNADLPQLQADAYYTYATALLCAAAELGSDCPPSFYQRVLGHCQRAHTWYTQIMDEEGVVKCLHLQALLYNELGMDKERDTAAAECLQRINHVKSLRV